MQEIISNVSNAITILVFAVGFLSSILSSFLWKKYVNRENTIDNIKRLYYCDKLINDIRGEFSNVAMYAASTDTDYTLRVQIISEYIIKKLDTIMAEVPVNYQNKIEKAFASGRINLRNHFVELSSSPSAEKQKEYMKEGANGVNKAIDMVHKEIKISQDAESKKSKSYTN